MPLHEDIYALLDYPQAHCDNRVLHKSCKYCEEFPEAQQKRIDLNVAFTDELVHDKIPCPAIVARSWDSLNSWAGNQPENENFTMKEKRYFAGIETNASRMMYGKWHDFKAWCKKKGR